MHTAVTLLTDNRHHRYDRHIMNNHSCTFDHPGGQAVSVAESAELMTSIARLYYLEKLGQGEIASIYGVSRSTISRMLTTARELGIVRISVDDYDPRDRELELRLTDRFGLRHAVVVRAVDGSDAATRRAVGYFAAPVVEEWLSTSRAVGLAGGRTLGELLRAISHRAHPQDLEVVQLMGMIGSSPSSVDASELSRVLASRFHGEFHNINAPAFVENKRTRDLFLSHGQIRSVWSRFPSLDLALVGIGTLEESVFVERQVFGDSEFAKVRRCGAVGEICGRFFDESGQECVSPFRDRVVSIGLDVLREGMEVVAVTTGRVRSDAVRAALKGGLVQSLVIDDAGASAVLAAT
jgi:DNA-binding transcriptional regulator LsrR (DeoR family)